MTNCEHYRCRLNVPVPLPATHSRASDLSLHAVTMHRSLDGDSCAEASTARGYNVPIPLPLLIPLGFELYCPWCTTLKSVDDPKWSSTSLRVPVCSRTIPAPALPARLGCRRLLESALNAVIRCSEHSPNPYHTVQCSFPFADIFIGWLSESPEPVSYDTLYPFPLLYYTLHCNIPHCIIFRNIFSFNSFEFVLT